MIFPVVALLVAISGCDRLAIYQARESVERALKDPSSAQFRNERVTKDGIVCGEVNGKNSFGAYSGFARFYSSKRAGEYSAVIETKELPAFVFDDMCD